MLHLDSIHLRELTESRLSTLDLVHSTTTETLLQELETSGDEKKQDLHRMCRDKGHVSYPFKTSLPELATLSLLDRVQNRPDVEGSLRILRKQRTKERGNAVYIPPQAKTNRQASDDAQFPLMGKVEEFLSSNQKVFLLLGESGSGKSTFSREFEYESWQSYKNKTGRIPLHISLAAIDKPEHDMIAKQLRRVEFTEPQIREMKQYRRFILICDGYDESQQTHNLYMSNRLNQPGEWNAQMVISCRSEYIGNDYRDRFQPGDRNCQSDSSLFQEAVMTPFSLEMVHAYIQQYVSVHQPLWQTSDYKQALNLIPNLKDLMKNPFLMTLSLEVLPRMVDPGQHLSTTRVTRVGLYDHFVQQWLERGKKRIGEKDLTPQAREAFERLSTEGFSLNGVEYLKRLAVAIHKEQGGHPVVEYSQLKDEGSWKDAFFSQKNKQLLLEASPLTRNGNQYRFIHRSLLDYGLALAVFDPQDKNKLSAPIQIIARRGSDSSIMSLELQNESEKTDISHGQEPDPDSPLVWRNFVNDHSLLQFLEERARQEPLFQEQLLSYLEYSKKDKKWRIAAANAITVLVRAGVQFIHTDLHGVRIPRADISYGVFDSVQLQGADLRKANLRGVWMRQTDLSRSQMTGVQFGELPLLTEDDGVFSCTFSPDGMSFAIGLFNGDISLYTTSNWERIRVLKGHSDWVRGIVYHPNGNQMASCSQDDTLRLWNVEAGTCAHIIIGRGGYLNGVAYSPQGDQLATAGGDGTVRLWDSATGGCRQTLSGHRDSVLCVAYSPKDAQVASGGSGDCTVRLWNVVTGDCIHILSSHSGAVWGVAYSPQGDQLASGSVDKTIRLWNVETGACRHILEGHDDAIYGIAYSPRGDQLASGCQDGTVRLWDVETGVCLHTLTGHGNSVFSVKYSPKGDQVASCSADNTLRLWDVSGGSLRVDSTGHSQGVYSVKCPLKGDQIASGGMDTTIRLWDAQTGMCLKVLRGHTDMINNIVYSPQGDYIASSSGDNTIRMWSVGSGVCEHVLIDHSGPVEDVAFSPQGHQVASVSHDKSVRLWNVATGECSATLNEHTDKVYSVAYSPDGRQIVTGSLDRTIRLWGVENGELHRTLQGHEAAVRNVAYSPRGNQLASASDDMTARLWDVEEGECRFILIGHSDWVWRVAYSQNGNLLASGSLDKTVRLWGTVSGQCRAVIQNFQDVIRAVDWNTTSDGLYLVTGCDDGSVLKWQVVEDEELCSVRLQWSATNGTLTMTGASIQDVQGLTQINKQLLKQRGAVGEPEDIFREASKKVMTMASVVSKLKQPSDKAVQDPPPNEGTSSEQPSLQTEEMNES